MEDLTLLVFRSIYEVINKNKCILRPSKNKRANFIIILGIYSYENYTSQIIDINNVELGSNFIFMFLMGYRYRLLDIS